MRQSPTIYSLDQYHALWATQECCQLWNVKPDTIATKFYCNSRLNLDIEIRYVEEKTITKLYNEKGLYICTPKCKYNEIISICDGTYYQFEEWWIYGQKCEENNVIEFEYNGKHFILEPLKYSEWKFINDCKNHQNNIGPNSYFKVCYNTNLGIPILSVVALQNIETGSQLFASYGSDYWTAYTLWLQANPKSKK